MSLVQGAEHFNPAEADIVEAFEPGAGAVAPVDNARLPARPEAMETPLAEPEPVWVEERIEAMDSGFHRVYLRGLAALWGNLWVGLGAMAVAAAALSSAMTEPYLAIGLSAGVGAAAYAALAAVTGLRLRYAHDKKVAEIQRTAKLGAARLRIDDPALVRGAMRDVLSEWMHGALLLRRLRRTSFWYVWAVVAELVAATALVGGLALVSPLDLGLTAALAGAALLLIGAHGWREIRGGKLRGDQCALGPELDPIDPLADRMVGLLDEVRQLRRRGEFR